jgi:glycosyltransferase involved in cell wall biosynthesis
VRYVGVVVQRPSFLHLPNCIFPAQTGGMCELERADLQMSTPDPRVSTLPICDKGDASVREVATARGGKARTGPALVSVVIPTLRRPALLARALASVFRQSWQNIEVIVVVDGPDAETVSLLQAIDDPRLKVIVNARSLTAAGARNAGLDIAKGEWIAFLDDDDEWLPNKLAKQLSYAADRGAALVSCLSRVVTPERSFVRPQTVYNKATPIDEYLFDQQSLFADCGFIQTSSYLMPREICGKIRFRTNNPHDDWDFLLRLSKQFMVPVETVPEVLVTLYVDEPRESLSKAGTWLGSLQWAEQMRPLMTPRAYSGFCLSAVASRAVNERAYGAATLLLYHAFRYGSPRLWRVAAYLGLWIMPRGAFAFLRRSVTSVRGFSSSGECR